MDPRRMCPHCRAFITIKDKVCPYCNEAVAPKQAQQDGGGLVGGFIPHVRFNTMIILLINFGLYIAAALFAMKGETPSLFSTLDGRTLILFGAKPRRLASSRISASSLASVGSGLTSSRVRKSWHLARS